MPHPRVCHVIACLTLAALATPATTFAAPDHAALRPERAGHTELEHGLRSGSATGLEEIGLHRWIRRTWDQMVLAIRGEAASQAPAVGTVRLSRRRLLQIGAALVVSHALPPDPQALSNALNETVDVPEDPFVDLLLAYLTPERLAFLKEWYRRFDEMDQRTRAFGIIDLRFEDGTLKLFEFLLKQTQRDQGFAVIPSRDELRPLWAFFRPHDLARAVPWEEQQEAYRVADAKHRENYQRFSRHPMVIQQMAQRYGSQWATLSEEERDTILSDEFSRIGRLVGDAYGASERYVRFLDNQSEIEETVAMPDAARMTPLLRRVLTEGPEFLKTDPWWTVTRAYRHKMNVHAIDKALALRRRWEAGVYGPEEAKVAEPAERPPSEDAANREARASESQPEAVLQPHDADAWDQRAAEGYRGATVAVLGGTGFVGRRYVSTLLERYGETVGQIRALSRNLDGVAAALGTHSKLAPYQGDHLDLDRMRALVTGATIIIDTAGLAWQHLPGGKAATLEDELLQNSMSAALIGVALQPGQRLIWTSSNASDYLFARMTETEQAALQQEIDERAARYAGWVRGLGDRAPTKQELEEFIRDDLGADPPQSFPDGPEGPNQKTIIYARAFSYPYSKLLGQRILEILGQEDGKEIVVLKISDVYGPGQGLGPAYWNPRDLQRQAARRPQWFLAVYEAIRRGQYRPWAREPSEGGFRKVGDHVEQTVFDDVVAPTYVDDVVEMLLKASVVELPVSPQRQVVLAVSAPWMTNVAMAQAIANAVGVKVLGQDIAVMSGKQILRREPPPASADLAVLGMAGRLTPFEDGIARHVAWWRARSSANTAAGLEEPTADEVAAATQRLVELLADAPQTTAHVLGPGALEVSQVLAGFQDLSQLILVDEQGRSGEIVKRLPAGISAVYYYGSSAEIAAFAGALQNFRPTLRTSLTSIEVGAMNPLQFLRLFLGHLSAPPTRWDTDERLRHIYRDLTTRSQA